MTHPFRSFVLAALLTVAALLFAGTAHAIYIEGDLPASLSFNNKNTDDPDSTSGLLLTAGDLFVGLGVGYEYYTATWNGTGGGSSTDVNFQYLDIVWSAPVPVVNLSIGAGFGIAFPEGDLGHLYKQGSMTQVLVRVGFPIAKVFDVHVGYHQFAGKMKGKTIDMGFGSTTFEDVTLDGHLITLGARFGF